MSDRDPLLDPPSWVPSWLSVDDVGAMRWFRWIVGLVFAAGAAACVVESADRPADPVLEDPAGLAARFGSVLVEVMTASGDALELCLLHADVPPERAQGLKGVTDLEGHDGMLFVWDEDAQSNFVMVDTVTPLTISWWTADGTFVSSADMTPCTEADDSACARYTATSPHRYAIEVFRGDRPELAEGATIAVRAGSSCQTS